MNRIPSKHLFILGGALILFTFSLCSLFAENLDPQKRFIEGNQAFEKGDLQQAEDIYLSLIKQDFRGAALYYNLGNIYYRKGERGKAILWFERAKHLAPRDSDIDYNLSLARSHLKDEKPGLVERAILLLGNSELGILTIFLVWIFFGLLGLKILRLVQGEMWPTLSLWISGLLLLFFGGWFVSHSYLDNLPMAIVKSPPGEVRNGPGQDYAVGFTIPEGSKVLVLEKRPDWFQVGVPQQGLKGWMPSKEVELISKNAAY